MKDPNHEVTPPAQPRPQNTDGFNAERIADAAKMTDDEILNFTKGVRITAVKKLTENGFVPSENGDKAMLMTILKDLDSQAINKKRLVIEEKGADNSSLIVAALLKQVDKKTAFRQLDDSNGQVVDVSSRVLPEDLPNPDVLPGEGEVNPPQLDYESFMAINGVDPANLGAAAANNPHPEAQDTGSDTDEGVDENY